MKLIIIATLSLILTSINYSYDLEIQIGKDIIESRLKVYKESAKRLKGELPKEDQKFLTKLEDEFSTLGGYNLVDNISSISLGWSESNKHQWVAKLKGNFDKTKLYAALGKTSWIKEKSFWKVEGLYLYETKEALIVVKTDKDFDIKKKLDFKIGVPQVKGASLSADQVFMKAWESKSEKGQPYLSMVKGLNIVLDGNLASLSLDFYDPSQAVFATGMISTGLEFLKGMIQQVKEKPGDKNNLTDWVSYSSNQMFAAQAMLHINKLSPVSAGSILSINYEMKTSVKELYKSFEGSFVLALGSVVTLLASKKMDLAKLKSLDLGLIPSVGGMNKASGPCAREIKIINQAVEFYNSDHVKTGPWNEIKPKVFAEGYLPEDLVCNGKLVKNNEVFTVEPNGSIRLK